MNPAKDRKHPQPLERFEIPTLVFGARTHLPHAVAWIIELGSDAPKCQAWLKAIEPHITYGHDKTETALVLGFTAPGLRKLGLPPSDLAAFSTAFQSGMTGPGRAAVLGDVNANDPANWQWGQGDHCDAILIQYASTQADTAQPELPYSDDLAAAGGRFVHMITLAARTRQKFSSETSLTTEPFGFADGISQPVIRGTPRAEGRRPEEISPAGDFILGYEGQTTDVGAISAIIPRRRDPQAILPPVTTADGVTGADLGRNGTFLVVRQLEQDVNQFQIETTRQARALQNLPPSWPVDRKRDWVQAKLVGRWQNGSPLVRHPMTMGKQPHNDFLYRAEDQNGLGCPLGAHIRRANPRDSLTSDPAVSAQISSRHRLLRVGRPYRDQVGNVGILFMCVNADIEMQFETVQQSWINRKDFHGLRREPDPLTGIAPNTGTRDYTIPTDTGPVRLTGLKDFVTVKGGGYFFLPSRAAIKFLAALNPEINKR